MPKQLDSFKPDFSLKPTSSLHHPRLWVRRLVIWRSPDQPALREITLRPGMNIIWTPDDGGIGHGAGKTLCCRLIRYCLGEDSFAPSEQQGAITGKFREGWVGAEVIVDGQPWGVLRPLGIRRKHYAVVGATPEDLLNGESEPTGMEPLVTYIEESLLTRQVCDLIPSSRQSGQAWLTTLAWLSRDQECRFDHVLDWRSTLSESKSPSTGLTKQERLQTLRALLGAITPEEQQHRQNLARCREEFDSVETRRGHVAWEISRLQDQIRVALRIDREQDFSLGDEILVYRAAFSRLAQETGTPLGEDFDRAYRAAKEAVESSDEEVNFLERRKAKLDGQIPVQAILLSEMKGGFPDLYQKTQEAEFYPCPICEVPISRVLAEGCGLSDKIPDLEKCKRRLDKNQAEVADLENKYQVALDEQGSLERKIQLAKESREAKGKALENLDNRRREWDATRLHLHRLESDIQRLADLLDEQAAYEADSESHKRSEKQHQQGIEKSIRSQHKVLAALNEKFDPIIRYLVGQDATSEARLTTNELALKVRLGGNRSTAAVDSLKVVAFDLAALCLSIEGLARIPAFLIHDSPREADLGLPLYHRLFHLLNQMELPEKNAAHQYIVTTTTRPPVAFRGEPWLRLELHGSPANERLLKADL